MYKQALFGTVFVHQYNNTALCLDANFSKSKISKGGAMRRLLIFWILINLYE